MKRELLIVLLILPAVSLAERAVAEETIAEPELAANRAVYSMLDRFGPSWIDARTPAVPRAPVGNSGPAPYWIPMCFLFDESIDAEKANATIQAMVSAYASCGIAIEPHPFTLRSNYPSDFEAVSVAAKLACPLSEAFGVRGSILVETRYPDLTRRMCHDRSAEGCSTLCAPTSISFVAPNAPPASAVHESMHANCCGPVCVDEGEGNGTAAGLHLELAMHSLPSKAHAALTGEVKETSITPEGCNALRSGATPSAITRWFRPGKKDYYVRETNPARQLDLTTRKSFLETAGGMR